MATALESRNVRENVITAAICFVSATIILILINFRLGMSSASLQPPVQIPEHHSPQRMASIVRKAFTPQPAPLPRQATAATPVSGQKLPAQQHSLTSTASLAAGHSISVQNGSLTPQQPLATKVGGLKQGHDFTNTSAEHVDPDPPWKEIAAFTDEIAQSIAEEDIAAAPKSLHTDSPDAASPEEIPIRIPRFGNLTVTGLVFFGARRMQRQRIVQCYVERNLVSNGGLLGEVIWQIQETASQADFAFLQDILDRQPKYYRKMVMPVPKSGAHFKNHYDHIDPDKYYLKLDDDIVWVADGAIEAMLEEKLRGRFLYVSANVINHSSFALMHARMGILDGYVPGVPGTRWQKLKGASFLDGSPAAGVDGVVLGNCWSSWKCAAVQHYNFFAHFKAGTLDQYKQYPTYDLHAGGYKRWSITFILFKGSELGVFTHGDDEELISNVFPAKAGKHCGAVGKALVAHYSYYTQLQGLNSQPEILSAYSVIAERTCGSLVGHGR